MKTTGLFLVLLLPLLATARLGESISDCDIRYGGGKRGTMSAEDRIKPLITGDGTTNLTYTYKGFTVRVGFRDSMAVRLDFTRIGTTKLSGAEIEQLLEANKGANPWYGMNTERAAGFVADAATFAKSDKELRGWRRLDETVAVLYNRGRSMRLILHEEEKPNKRGGPKPEPPTPTPGSTTF